MTFTKTLCLEPNDSVGSSVSSLLSSLGFSLRSDCGGRGLCGKCRVKVNPPENCSSLTDAELEILSQPEVTAGIRLACQACATDKIEVVIPEGSVETDLETAKTITASTFEVSPIVRREVVTPCVHDSGERSSLVSILKDELPQLRYDISLEPGTFRELALHFSETHPFTLVVHGAKGITAVLPGCHNKSLGFSVDLGTTTLAGYLCDLRTGKILSTSSSSNPQMEYGADVITRIAFASHTSGGVDLLQRLVINQINSLLLTCVRSCGAATSDVDEIVIVGNSTMQHLFCGLNPYSLGISPYRPVTHLASDWRASDLGLNVNPFTNVHVFPVISGFLGGDCLAAILADRPYLRNETTLLLDLGTNGEIILCNGPNLWATSCATGPAFEGAHITCGMRAVPGAIHSVRINPANYSVSYDFFTAPGIDAPQGICGSGIIDTVAEMRRAGVLLPGGRFNEGVPGVKSDSSGVGRSFVLVPAELSATGLPVELTLKDVRQIQLAKGALEVGLKLLMKSAGIENVDRLVLTGGFGSSFNWKNAAAIGILPASITDRHVESIDNAAGVGAVAALLSENLRSEAVRLSTRIRALELNDDAEFTTEFPMSVGFPLLQGETEK
ncbi:MAG: ASKHA domain-containing protein [Pseudomonadota bacterium]